MSVSGITGVLANGYQAPGAQTQYQQDIRALIGSLNSGNLSGAQQAYSSLTQLQSSGQGPQANSNNPFAQALSQIGQALQSGNLTAAQQALSSLQQVRGGHHHHGHHGGAANASASPVTTSASSGSPGSSSANTVNITA